MVNVAPIKWAQRSDSIYVTINLPDVTDEKVELTPNRLKFRGKSQGKEYECDLELLRTVKSEGSVWKVLPRSVQVLLNKEDNDKGFWERLLKDKQLEKTNVKVDWDRYIDEDEEEDNPAFDMKDLEGGMDFSQLGGMGGMGGMGGLGGADQGDDYGEPDSDDDELPDLETDENDESKDKPVDN